MKLTQCKINHLTNPLGYQMDHTVFSWCVEEALGACQKSARICVSLYEDLSEPLLDTGWRNDLDSVATELALPLSPRTRFYWTVQVRSDRDEMAASEVNWFETGKRDEPWQASWISCEKSDRHPVFEKLLTIQKPLRSARLYICGLGLYEAFLDGQRIGGEYLTPYCNNYHKWLQYQTYDVTEQAIQGGILQILMGNGWYSGRFGYASKPGDAGHYGQSQKLIAELRLSYVDGTEEVIGTDESWAVRRSKLTFSNIYDGEWRDDTLPELPSERPILINESVPLVERYSLPVLVQEQISPVKLLHTRKGELVFDMGQNLTGSFVLRVREPAGTKVHLQFGEVLQDGCFYRDNLRSALAEYWYTSGGEEVLLQPHFTFYGYRYVKIEGITQLALQDFTALVLHSDLPETGLLSTGHTKVNQLIRNVEWGQRGNFLDVPTDCPQRDERLGWTGDAQVFSATSCYLRDSYAFYRKYLHDMATEQEMAEGKVPDVVPSFDPYYATTSSVWGDAACIIPWNLYSFYGDLSILRECYPSMKAWVDYIHTLDGENHQWRRHFHYADWLALDHPSGRPDQCIGGTEEGYVADIYYAYSAEIVSKAAGLLEMEQDAVSYSVLAQKIRADLRDEYFSANGRCCVDTQTGLILALRHHLSPKPDACVRRLREKFNMTGGKLHTGFVGTPLLCGQLTEAGMERLAYDLLLNEEYPGWLYAVNLGATTVWERWNSMNPDGSVSSTGMNSFNHYSYGAILEWMFRYAAGLQNGEGSVGFRKAFIAPVPDVRLGFLQMQYQSAAGTYTIYWETLDKYTLHLKVEVPFGCTAELRLPYAGAEVTQDMTNPMFRHTSGNVCYLTAGTYEVTYHTAEPMGWVFHMDDKVSDLLANAAARRCLEQLLPQIAQLPDALKGQSLRTCTERYLGDIPARMLSDLEKALAEL